MSIKATDFYRTPKPREHFAPGVTVVIPTIRPRHALLRRALESVAGQTLRPHAVVVVEDVDRQGAAATRHRGLLMSRTEHTAFLDDDDEFLPNHLETLHTTAVEHGAGYVWSRFRVAMPFSPGRLIDVGEMRKFSFHDGPAPLGAGTFQQWNDEQPAQTTVTTLVNTARALDVGGFLPRANTPMGRGEIDGQRAGEDWDFTLRMRAAGVVFRHAPHVTWNWHHHGANTSGLPSNW